MKAACVGVADAGSIFGKSAGETIVTPSMAASSALLASHDCTLVVKSCLRVVLPKQKAVKRVAPLYMSMSENQGGVF